MLPRICLRLLIVLALFAFCIAKLHAGPIVGSQVTGSLRFGSDAHDAFDPANKQVPNGFLNKASTTVTISDTLPEFGFKDSLNFYSANFTETQLIITDQILGTSNRFTMVFTDDAFIGATLNKTSDKFTNGGLVATVDGATITVTWVGTKGVAQFKTLEAIFNIILPPAAPTSPVLPTPGPAAPVATATPEPSTWFVFAVLIGPAVVYLKRRRTATC